MFYFILMQDCNKYDIQSYLQAMFVEILAVWKPDLLPVFALIHVNTWF